ncbi:class C sortase [Gemella cuniculi]|uniref:class C sortase n=1 Tax=Gemella cuniculi TaxID=150240 RepID=UPI00041D5BBB|nr:class C sortase [Gemella cuniculi]
MISSKEYQNRKKRNQFSIFIFILGICLVLFPIVSQISYFIISHKQINEFEKEIGKINTSEIDRRIELANAYNGAIKNDGIGISDPYTNLQQEGRTEYARMLQVHEQIGYVNIPSINTKIPIYAGSSDIVLQKGAGHLEGTSLPVGGSGTHTVITAHSGLPTAHHFTDLHKVKVGDVFFIRNIKEILAYKVNLIKVVEPTDLEEVAIEDKKDYATLLTCTPYMINSHRLLVRGERIPYMPEQEQQERGSILKSSLIQLILILLALLSFILIAVWIRKGKKCKRSV